MPKAQLRDREEESKGEVPRQDEEVPREEKVRENMAITAFKAAKPYLLVANSLAGVYILWMFLHFVSANLYVYYCANMSFIGFFMSPILASAPHCRAIRWIMNAGAQSIDTMWIVLGTWVCSKLVLVGGTAAVTPAPANAK